MIRSIKNLNYISRLILTILIFVIIQSSITYAQETQYNVKSTSNLNLLDLTYQKENYNKESQLLKKYLKEQKNQNSKIELENESLMIEEIYFEFYFLHKMYQKNDIKMALFLQHLYAKKHFKHLNKNPTSYYVSLVMSDSVHENQHIQNYFKEWNSYFKFPRLYTDALMVLRLHHDNEKTLLNYQMIGLLIDSIENEIIKSDNALKKRYEAILASLYYGKFLHKKEFKYLEKAAYFSDSIELKENSGAFEITNFYNDLNFFRNQFLNYLNKNNLDHPKKEYYILKNSSNN